MKVILLEDRAGVGRKHDVVTVAKGYALNFLIPQKRAIPATSGALKNAELFHATRNEQKRVSEEALSKIIAALDGERLTVRAKANEQGNLFAALHAKDIVRVLESNKRGVVPVAAVTLPREVKEVGEYPVTLTVGETTGEMILVVESEKEK